MDSSMQKAEILFYEFFLDAKVKSEGTLSVEKEGDIRIKSKNSIMPCQYIENISDYSASLSQPKRYNRIAIIKSQRQYLYRSPNEGAATKAYLIKCDPVIIVKQQGQWLLIKYLKNEKTERWIPSSAVFL